MTEPVITKTCTRCHTDKPLSEFWANCRSNDGLVSQCKQCLKTQRNTPEFKEKKRQYHHTERVRQKDAAHRRTDAYRIRNNIRNQTAYKKHPEKGYAYSCVQGAIKKGDLAHPNTVKCSNCPEQAQEYHHSDYSKPLSVIAVCKLCHAKIHR